MKILSLIAVLIGLICSTDGRTVRQTRAVKASDWVLANSTQTGNAIPHMEEEEEPDSEPEIRSGCVTECVINPVRRKSCGFLNEDQCAEQGCCYDQFAKVDEITCYKKDEKTCPKPACEALKPAERTTCSLLKGLKDMMDSEFYCVNVGCCWDNSSLIYPKCFNQDTKVEHSNCLYINNENRISCGEGLSKVACQKKGCCFSPVNEMDVPWCYHSDKMYYSGKTSYSKEILKSDTHQSASSTTGINYAAINEMSSDAKKDSGDCVNLDYKHLCGRTNITEGECLGLNCCWVIDVNGVGLCFKGKTVARKITTTPETPATNPPAATQHNTFGSPGLANPFACLFGPCKNQQQSPNSQFHMMTGYEAQQNAMQPSAQDIQKEKQYLQQQAQRDRLNPLSQNTNIQKTANPMSLASLMLCMGSANKELCNIAMMTSLMGQSISPATSVPAYNQGGQRNYQAVSTKTGLQTKNATVPNVTNKGQLNGYYQNDIYAQQKQQQRDQMMQMMCLMNKNSPICSIMEMMKPVSPSEALTRDKWFNFIISHGTDQPVTTNVNNPFGGRLNEVSAAPTGDEVLDKKCKAASKAKETAGVSCPCGEIFSSKSTPTTEKECVARGCCWIKDLQSQLMESLGPMAAILLGQQFGGMGGIAGMPGMTSSSQPRCIESLGQKRINKMTMFTTMYGSQPQKPISSVAICALLGKQQTDKEGSADNEGERGLNPLALTMMATQGAQGGSGMNGLLMASLLQNDGDSDIASMIPILSMMSSQQTTRNPTTGQTGLGSPAYSSPSQPTPSPMANMGLMYSMMSSGNGGSMASKLPLILGMMGQGGANSAQMNPLPLLAMMSSNDNNDDDSDESSSSSSSLSNVLPLILAGGNGGMSGMSIPAMMMMMNSAGGGADSSSMSEILPLILQMQASQQSPGSTAAASSFGSSMSSAMSLLPLLSQSSSSSSGGINPALFSLLANGGGSPGMSAQSQNPSTSLMTSLLPLISSNNDISSILPSLLAAGSTGGTGLSSPFTSPLRPSYGNGYPSGEFSSGGLLNQGFSGNPTNSLFSSVRNQGRTNPMLPGLASGTKSRSLQINANKNDTHDAKILTAILLQTNKDAEHSAKPETTVDPTCLYPPGAIPTACSAQTEEACHQMNCCWNVTMPVYCFERTT